MTNSLRNIVIYLIVPDSLYCGKLYCDLDLGQISLRLSFYYIFKIFMFVENVVSTGREFAVAFQYTDANRDDGHTDLYFTTSEAVAIVNVWFIISIIF